VSAILNPVGQHAAALTADSHHGQLDDLVERGSSSGLAESAVWICFAMVQP
jgi:hypothetical protein